MELALSILCIVTMYIEENERDIQRRENVYNSFILVEYLILFVQQEDQCRKLNGFPAEGRNE